MNKNNLPAEQLAVALEELARLVRHTDNKQSHHMVKVGEGYAALEYMVYYDFLNVHALELRFCPTPPPLETGQNVVHTDDDDGDDGGKSRTFMPSSEMIDDLCGLNIWQKGLDKFLGETGDKC